MGGGGFHSACPNSDKLRGEMLCQSPSVCSLHKTNHCWATFALSSQSINRREVFCSGTSGGKWVCYLVSRKRFMVEEANVSMIPLCLLKVSLPLLNKSSGRYLLSVLLAPARCRCASTAAQRHEGKGQVDILQEKVLPLTTVILSGACTDERRRLH